MLTATFEDHRSNYEPMWINHRWVYKGKKYRSLRLVRSSATFKVERDLANIFTSEICREIDQMMIERIKKKVLNIKLL